MILRNDLSGFYNARLVLWGVVRCGSYDLGGTSADMEAFWINVDSFFQRWDGDEQ